MCGYICWGLNFRDFFPDNTGSKAKPWVIICLCDFPVFFLRGGGGGMGLRSQRLLFLLILTSLSVAILWGWRFERCAFFVARCPLLQLTENQILRCERLITQAGNRALSSPSCPLGTSYPLCPASFPKSHTIDLVLFCAFVDLDSIKRELGHYPSILTVQTCSITYRYTKLI